MKVAFRFEPTIWAGVIRQIITLAVLFGLNLTQEQMAGIFLTTEVIMTAINRSVVSPEATVAIKSDEDLRNGRGSE